MPQTEAKYPLFYSLSTIGLRKHYNQDYLLHAIRTDFTGDGGVGKSMIADFLQILFVWKKDDIKFGTEAVGNTPRDVKGMLHKDSIEGYIFANIEVSKNKFIVLGVCISRSGIPTLKPFLILNSTNWLFDRDIYIEKPITFQYFIKGNKIIAFDETAEYFQSQNLYFFNKSREQEELYNWLYEKKILSINLSEQSNLKAFAKVIQSFSKAKSLNLKSDSSLKEFLFEDAATENEKKFNEQKDKIQNLLQDYQEVKGEIELLKRKQVYLENLFSLNLKEKTSFEDWKKAELILGFQEKEKALKNWQEKSALLEKKQEEEASQKDKLETLEGELETVSQDFNRADNDLIHLINYKTYSAELNGIEDKISTLKDAISQAQKIIDRNKQTCEENKEKIEAISEELPALDTKVKNREETHNIYRKKSEDIAFAKPFYLNYHTFEQTEQKYFQDKEKVATLKAELEAEQTRLTQLKAVFDTTNQDKNSFFQAVLQKKQPLSLAQESVLFHFIPFSIEKKTSLGKYVNNPNELLNEANYEKVAHKNGFWLKLGAVSEFITNKPEQYFDNPKKVEEVLTNQKEKIQKQLTELKHTLTTLKELAAGRRPQPVIDFVVQESIDLDLFILSESKLNDLNELFELVKQEHKISESLVKSKKEYEIAIADKTSAISEKDRLAAENTRLSGESSRKESERFESERDLKRKEYDKVDKETLLITRKSNISFHFESIDIEAVILKTEEEKVRSNHQKKEIERQKNSANARILELTGEISGLETIVNSLLQISEDKNEKWEVLESEFLKEFEHIQIEFSLERERNEKEVEQLKTDYGKNKEAYNLFYKKAETEFPSFAEEPLLKEQIERGSYTYEVMEKGLVNGKTHTQIPDLLASANQSKTALVGTLKRQLWSIFENTRDQYKKYDNLVQKMNNFFKGKKISNSFYFEINFEPSKKLNIDWIKKLQSEMADSLISELNPDEDPEQYVFSVFQKLQKYDGKILSTKDLLDPRKYFELSVNLTDESKQDTAGSNSQGYAAIALLCIGRLSIIEQANRRGLRFIILEEVSNMSDDNFEMFIKVSHEFGYQILTMTPKPYGYFEDMEWYHYSLYGKANDWINYPPTGKFKLVEDKVERHEELKRLQEI